MYRNCSLTMETGFARNSHLKYSEEHDRGRAKVVCITVEIKSRRPENEEAQLTVSLAQEWDGVGSHSYSYQRVSTAGHQLSEGCSSGHLLIILILHLSLFYHRTGTFWAFWTDKKVRLPILK